MRSRKALAGAVVLATLLATVGIAGAVVTGGSPAQTAPSDSSNAPMSDTVTVGASGQVQAAADRAVVDVAVVAAGDEIAEVRERLTDNVSEMRAALADRGINESQIRTSHYDISTERRYGGPREEAPTYRAVHAFSISVNDTGTVGEVIDTAVTNGADAVDGVRFTLSPDRRERLREQALQRAMSAARSEAGTIASQANLTIVGVDRVTTTEYDRTPYRVEDAALAAGGDGGTSIDSGPVSVSASVTVVYDVE